MVQIFLTIHKFDEIVQYSFTESYKYVNRTFPLNWITLISNVRTQKS